MGIRDQYTVAEIVDTDGFTKPLATIVALCLLLMVCDSYDVAALSFVAPVLIKNWGLSSSFMGVVFSAGMLGLLVGSITFGQVGDRFGRKRAMVIGALSFSVLTALTGVAETQNQLLVLRFLATIGLGGAVPNAVALIGEFSPRRLKITSVGAIFAGYSIGGIMAGLSAATIIPHLGWPAMFFLGGGISLICTATFAWGLPESLSFLALRPSKAKEAICVASKLRPDLTFTASTRILPEDSPTQGGRVSDLFLGRLSIVTPLMWLIYIANSITVFGLTSWMPVFVEAMGLSRGTAAIATALMYAGSAVGGIVGGKFADRFGIRTVTIMALVAFVAVASIGVFGASTVLLFPISFLAGGFAFGGQTCLHGIVGSFYPTAIRANGVGWAIGIAKIGSILGPVIGGLLLPNLKGGGLFIATALPLVIVVVLSAIMNGLRETGQSAVSVVPASEALAHRTS